MRVPWLVVGVLIGVAGGVLTSPCMACLGWRLQSSTGPPLLIGFTAFWIVVGLALGLYLDATKGKPPQTPEG